MLTDVFFNNLNESKLAKALLKYLYCGVYFPNDAVVFEITLKPVCTSNYFDQQHVADNKTYLKLSNN